MDNTDIVFLRYDKFVDQGMIYKPYLQNPNIEDVHILHILDYSRIYFMFNYIHIFLKYNYKLFRFNNFDIFHLIRIFLMDKKSIDHLIKFIVKFDLYIYNSEQLRHRFYLLHSRL